MTENTKKKALILALSPGRAEKLAQDLLDEGWEVISIENENQDFSLPSTKTIFGAEASQTIRNWNCQAFGLVVIELVDFKALKDVHTDYWDGVELIDDEAMFALLQAAKEHKNITLVCDPEDYERVSLSIKQAGYVVTALRESLTAKSLHYLSEHIFSIVAFLQLTNSKTKQVLDKQENLFKKTEAAS